MFIITQAIIEMMEYVQETWFIFSDRQLQTQTVAYCMKCRFADEPWPDQG